MGTLGQLTLRPADHRLRIATYNVHRCQGTDGKKDLERVLAVIQSVDADVVALQEVESFPDQRPDFLKLLARRTDYRIETGPAMRRADSDYGNALLSRVPIEGMERLDLSVAGREPRGAIVARLRHGGFELLIIAIHLGRRGFERRRQVGHLLAYLNRLGPDSGGATQALLGDLNEWLPASRVLRRLEEHFEVLLSRATYPSRFPLLPLDRIGFRPAPPSLTWKVHSGYPAEMASDHLPLIAEF